MSAMSAMTRSFYTVLLASALAAPAFAGADIVRCVDAAGRVTLTDSGCGAGEGKLVVARVKPVKAGIDRASLAPELPSHDSWVDPRPHSKMLARDAATLKAARTSLQVMDEARQQRVAVN